MPTVGAKLRTLAWSASLADLFLLKPKKPLGCDALDDPLEDSPLEDSARDLSLYVCVSIYESCCVGLDTSCGLMGDPPCDVEGRESSGVARLAYGYVGRGGSGGGVPSLDSASRLLRDDFRDALCIMLIVGFVNSLWSLFVGELTPWVPALPDSDILRVSWVWCGREVVLTSDIQVECRSGCDVDGVGTTSARTRADD